MHVKNHKKNLPGYVPHCELQSLLSCVLSQQPEQSHYILTMMTESSRSAKESKVISKTKILSTHLFITISLRLQHVSTSKKSFQPNSVKYMKENISTELHIIVYTY